MTRVYEVTAEEGSDMLRQLMQGGKPTEAMQLIEEQSATLVVPFYHPKKSVRRANFHALQNVGKVLAKRGLAHRVFCPQLMAGFEQLESVSFGNPRRQAWISSLPYLVKGPRLLLPVVEDTECMAFNTVQAICADAAVWLGYSVQSVRRVEPGSDERRMYAKFSTERSAEELAHTHRLPAYFREFVGVN